MSLHLHTKSFEAPLGDRGKDDLWREKKDLLDDPAKCAELIAGYQAGRGSLVRHRARRTFRAWRRSSRRRRARSTSSWSERRVDTKRLGLVSRVFRAGIFQKTAPARRHGHEWIVRRTAARRRRVQSENTLVVPVSKSGNTENVIQETALLMERGYPALAITSSGRASWPRWSPQRISTPFRTPIKWVVASPPGRTTRSCPWPCSTEIWRWPVRSTPPSPPFTKSSGPLRPYTEHGEASGARTLAGGERRLTGSLHAGLRPCALRRG